MVLVLDSGAISRLARRSRQGVATIEALRREGLWPPLVPSSVLVESLTGRPGTDTNANRLLRSCEIVTDLSEATARRAARLRAQARRGSAVDAIVIALAEPSGFVLTGDVEDLSALAAHAADVVVRRI